MIRSRPTPKRLAATPKACNPTRACLRAGAHASTHMNHYPTHGLIGGVRKKDVPW
jgi:hypothetical protein